MMFAEDAIKHIMEKRRKRTTIPNRKVILEETIIDLKILHHLLNHKKTTKQVRDYFRMSYMFSNTIKFLEELK